MNDHQNPMKVVSLRKLNAIRVSFARFSRLLVVLVLSLSSVQAHAIFGSVYVGPIPNADFKVGKVMARAIVIDPETGQPILVEFAQDGTEQRVVSLAGYNALDLRIMPANDYHAEKLRLESYQTEHANGVAKTAELLSRAQYENADFLMADGVTPIQKLPLPEGINSVYVRGQGARLSPDGSSLILLAFQFDLTQGRTPRYNDKSLIVNDRGIILDSSPNAFGYRVGFFGDPNAPQEGYQRGIVRPDDQIFGPIPNTKVFVDQHHYVGGVDVSNNQGGYSFKFMMPLCPLGGYDFKTDVWAELRYRNFLPTGAPSIPYYLRTPGYSYCYATLAPALIAPSLIAIQAGYAVPFVQHNLYADIMFVTGRISLRNPLYESVDIGDTTYAVFEEDAEREIPDFYDFNADGVADKVHQGRILQCTAVEIDLTPPDTNGPNPTLPGEEESQEPDDPQPVSNESEITIFLSDDVSRDDIDPNPHVYAQGFTCEDKHPDLEYDPEKGGPWQGVYFDGRQDSVIDFPDLVRVADHETRLESSGVLKSISTEDLRNTDLLFFRESTGQLILERRGLKPEEAEYSNAIEYDEDAKQVAYRVMLRGSHDYNLNIGGGVNRRQSFEEWATDYQLTEPFAKREADHPRPGEFIKVVAINRATGYMGTARVMLTSAAENNLVAGLLDVEVPHIVMTPPNLKIWAQRDYEVDAGLNEGDEHQNTIGNEGAALTSDAKVTIYTEWLDEYGQALPEELGLDDGAQYGLTGRLAKVASPNQLRGVALADDLAEFPIAPGRNTQVLRVRSGTRNAGTDHFYVHVIGKPKDQECVSDASCPSFSVTNDNPGLAGRPELLTPFLTPLWYERGSWMQYRAYRSILSNYTVDTPEEQDNIPIKPDPIYAWRYRPEYQFSQYDFDVSEINRELTDPEGNTTEINIIDAPNPVITGDEDVISVIYTLIGDQVEALTPIDGERELILSFGGSEQIITIDNSGTIRFENLDALSQITPEDFLNIRLYTNSDEGNTLWEYQFEEATKIGFSRTISIATFNSTETSTATIKDVTDSFIKLPFVLQERSIVSIDVLDEDLSPRGSLVFSDTMDSGAYGFIVTYGDMERFFDPEDTFYIAVSKEGVFSGEETRQLFTGKLAERVDSEVLGQVIEHDSLIQRGALTLRREDIKVSGVGPQPDFIRSYSNEAQLTNSDGPMGPGWNHNHNIYLKILATSDADGLYDNNLPKWIRDYRTGDRPEIIPLDEFEDVTEIPQLVTVSNGGMFIFKDGSWRPSRGFHGKLELDEGQYVYTSKDGTQYVFQSTVSSAVDERFLVEKIIDRNDNELIYEYQSFNGQQLVSKVTDASGRSLEFSYQLVSEAGQYRLMQVESPEMGITLDFEYETLTPTQYDPDTQAYTPAIVGLTGFARENFTESYSYFKTLDDKIPNLTSTTDANGNVTEYAYLSPLQVPAALLVFAKGTLDTDVISQIKYPGNTGTAYVEYLFGNGNQRRVTDLNGNQKTYTLNQFGNPNLVEEPLDKRTEMVWTIDNGDDDVLMVELKDALGRVTTYEYDDQGNVVKQTDPLGTMTQSWHPEFSLLESRTDRNGNTINNSYDDNGNLTEAKDAEGFITRHTYSGEGLRLTTRQPDGGTINYQYDDYGNLQQASFPESSTYKYSNDARGNKLSESDANSHLTKYTYDDLDRVTKILHPDQHTSTFTYDAKGNKLTETDKLGLTLTYTYDERDRVERVTRSFGGGEQLFTYDNQSNLLTETDWKGQVTTHTYDTLYRRTSTKNRIGDTMSMTYDLVDNMLTMTDYRNQITEYTYDEGNRKVKEINALDDERVFTYDNENNMLSESDFEGRVTSVVYDKRYLKVEQINAIDGVAKWVYDGRGNNIEYTDEEQRTTKYVFDRQNRLVEERDALGFVTRVKYDGNGNQIEVTDRRGITTKNTYDAINRVTETLDGDSFVTKFSYDANDNRTQVTDGNGHSTHYDYDLLNRLIEETTPVSGTIKHTYDANDNVLTTTDAIGTVYARTYDASDRLLTETEAQGTAIARTRTTTYDANDNPVTVQNFRGFTTRFDYDALNRVVTATDPDTKTITYTYDAVGNKLTSKDRRGFVTTYEYDDLDRVTATIDALDQRVETTYDGVGNALTVTDKRGTVTTNTYDALNRLLTSTKPDGNGAQVKIVRNEYDREGNLSAVTDANNNRVQYAYNGRNLQTKITNPDTTVIETTYDGAGNTLTVKDEAGQVTTNTYDDANRLLSSTNHANETTRFEYDLNDNKTKTTRPKGTQTSYAYDALNRVERITDGELNVTLYTYDANDNQRSHRDANSNVVTYEYDALDRRIEHRQPNQVVTTFRYDEEGNMVGRTDPNGRQFTYTYDAINRQTSESYPPVPSPYMQVQLVETEYDGNNNPVKTTEHKVNNRTGGGIIDVSVRTFDLLDRLTQDTQRGHVISYQYDDNGNRTQVTSVGGSTSYTYDNRNRLRTATTENGTSTYTYTADSKQAQVAYPNGTITRYDYDAADRTVSAINERVVGNATELISRFDYDYDLNSNRVLQTETQNGFTERKIQTTTYEYDNADRMTGYVITDQETGDVHTADYTFDFNYNRVTEVEKQTVGGVTTTIKDRTSAYDANNRLTSITDNLDPDNNSIDYTYDANGNTLTKTDNTQSVPALTTFRYDSRNQLTQVIRGPPENEESRGLYDYNALGMRVRHLDSERGDIEYLYDGKSILEERTLGTNTLLAHYRYSDRLLSLNTATDEHYYHYSALRTTANLTNVAGEIQASYRTDVWGHITAQEGSSPNRQVFTGQEHDENTGLIYFGARYYDPDTARFINEDTYLGESNTPPSLHRYLYAYGNPTVYVDLDGYASTTTILDQWAESAAMEGNNIELGVAVTAQAFYKLGDFVTFGWISSHDEARDARDSGEITTEEYHDRWQKAGLKSGSLFLATAATGGAASIATRGLGTGAIATTSRFATVGAASGVGYQATEDAWEGELSGADDYLKSAGMGALGGVVARGALGAKNKLGDTTVKEGVSIVKAKLQTAKVKTGDTLTAEGSVLNGNRASNVADSASYAVNADLQRRAAGFKAYKRNNGIASNQKVTPKQYRSFNGGAAGANEGFRNSGVGNVRVNQNGRVQVLKQNSRGGNYRSWTNAGGAKYASDVKAHDHHLFTKQLFERYRNSLPNGYLRDHPENLIRLHTPFHGNHPAYTNFVDEKFLRLLNNGPVTMKQMKDLQSSLRKGVEKIRDEGKVQRLNDYFKSLGY